MKNRTVAFIDILGFKEIVKSGVTNDVGKKFSRILGKTLPGMNQPICNFPNEPSFFKNKSEKDAYCISYAFSDSIILISNDDSEESALAVLIYALRVSQIMIGHKFPVRGAITYGEMYVDEKNSLFLGEALTKAYELEQRQNWIGVIIDDSLSNNFHDILVKNEPTKYIRQRLFPKYEVPMKNGSIREYYTLNWRWNLIAPKGTKEFFNISNEWSAKIKIDNALLYAKEMRRSNLAYPHGTEDIPIEVRTIYIAEGPPPKIPPKHGDEY